MTSPLQSIIDAGSKVWLDSVDPDLVRSNRERGITGATSNPIIVADLVKSGRFDEKLTRHFEQGLTDEDIAWAMTDMLVTDAQGVFEDVHASSAGDDGWVSFELDPLLEDEQLAPSHEQRVSRYIDLAKRWSAGRKNRMIKVPATAAGLDALEEIAAHGITLNVTLIFTLRQYRAARDAIWRGRQRHGQLERFKSVYSIFVSRVDVYTAKHEPELSDAAQGQVGIVNAKSIWKENRDFWADKDLPLKQEMIFASTGAKLDWQKDDYYIEAFVGSDIMTNPPDTNDAIERSGKTYQANVQNMPEQGVLDEIDQKLDVRKLEQTLMAEGTKKFADPHKKLIESIGEKRAALNPA